ncbi:MAG: hypothetical protein ABSF28_04470 [Terracidiphilus sp.]|jgi:hypothetical protein
MREPINRNLLQVFAFVLASASVAYGQNVSKVEISVANSSEDWKHAEDLTPIKSKRYVVTIDQPDRKQSCRVQSFTDDELVCSRANGGSRTYKREQIVALIVPGTKSETLAFFLGFNTGLGASIWGTVALVATCPVCAAGTALAAFIFFELAGVTAMSDDASAPEKLLYLAHGQMLSNKFRSVER